MPGLLTLQLPLTIKTGENFTVDVQHHSGITFQKQVVVRRKPRTITLSHRSVLGGFQVHVAVRSGEPLTRKLVRNLAALRYTFQAIPTSDNWHPVFKRYISQLAAQITGLGIDASQIPASLDDPGLPGETKEDSQKEIIGKIREVFFDCFGDFEGFEIETCCDSHYVSSKEPKVAEIVLQACRERCTVKVVFSECGLKEITILC
jgi:hypothetical protein